VDRTGQNLTITYLISLPTFVYLIGKQLFYHCRHFTVENPKAWMELYKKLV